MEITERMITDYYFQPLDLSDEQYRAVKEYLDREHERKCVPLIRAREGEIAFWRSQWPYHCDTCEGKGGVVIHGYPHAPDDFELCICAEQLKCARCGEVNPQWEENDADAPCACCGWNWGRNKDDAVPESYECEHMMM